LEVQKASLEEENPSLAEENYTLLAKVVEEKQQIWKQVSALASSQAGLSSHTFVSKLEHCTKQEMAC
jgi:hypothetical protein